MIIGIHYLRAIAALMVVFHHTLKYTNIHEASAFGAAGVDIFFVISGFVMAWTTRDIDVQNSPLTAARTFLKHRFIRVVPLYWLALLWNIKTDLVRQTPPDGAFLDFAFIPRFNPLQGGDITPVLVPGWTINYEIFFYAMFAFSILFGKWRTAVLFSIMLTCIACGHFFEPASAPGIFYSNTVILEFLYGAVLAKLFQRTGLPEYHHVAMAGVALGFAALLFVTRYTNASMRAFYCGPLAILIVASSISAFQHGQAKILHLLGDASFSIYLTHSFTFKISGHLFDAIFHDAQGMPFDILEVIFRISIAAGIGIIAHLAIEKPMTRSIQHWFKQHQPRKSSP